MFETGLGKLPEQTTVYASVHTTGLKVMKRAIYDLLLKGQRVVVRGKENSYKVSSPLTKSVFKAYVQDTTTPVVLKTEDHPVLYEREVNAYEFDCIRESPYIRTLREVVDNNTDRCMVFEWMDQDLWSIRKQNQSPNYLLLKTVARSVLKALTAFSYMDGQGAGAHTDVNPNNILVSDVDTLTPVVKLADLGCLIKAGNLEEYRLQGFAIRAPEIWMGHPLSSACDVWSVGVSLAHFLAAKGLFGPSDMNVKIATKPHEMVQAAWSIGKICQLVGPLPRKEDPRFKAEFDLAETLVRRGFIKVGTLDDELTKFGVSTDCMKFIQYLLTLDPEERPTAKQALEHPWLQGIS